MKTATRLIRDIAITSAVVYGAVTGIMWAVQDRLIYPGAFSAVPAWINVAYPVAVERVTVPVGDGVHLMALYRRPDPGQPTVIVFHGNAGYPEDYGFLYKSWEFSGYGIVAPVYRGYPRSSGKVDAAGMMRDALSVYDWTAKRHPSSPVIAFGQSLGTASAVMVSANRSVRRHRSHIPFKSMLSVVSNKFRIFQCAPPCARRSAATSEMPKVSSPTIIFHGDVDDLVPIGSARELASLAPVEPRFVVIEERAIRGLYGNAMVTQMNAFIADHGRNPR